MKFYSAVLSLSVLVLATTNPKVIVSAEAAVQLPLEEAATAGSRGGEATAAAEMTTTVKMKANQSDRLGRQDHESIASAAGGWRREEMGVIFAATATLAGSDERVATAAEDSSLSSSSSSALLHRRERLWDQQQLQQRKLVLPKPYVQRGADFIGGPNGDDLGWSISLSSDGSVLAIAVPGADGNTGRVRVYDYASGVWTQRGGDICGDFPGDFFGTSVALSGNGSVLAAGAKFVYSNIGVVRVYEYATGAWAPRGDEIRGDANNDFFGTSVSLSSDGSVLAAGAPSITGNSSAHGRVRVYEYASGFWNQRGGDINGDAQDGNSGSSVILSSDGSVLAIAAPYSNPFLTDWAGRVRVYEYACGVWNQRGGDLIGDARFNSFGLSVSLSSSGSVLAVGEPFNDRNGPNDSAGLVRVYEYASGIWTQRGGDIVGKVADDRSGSSVSLSSDGSVLAIGATHSSPSGINRAGSVRVFDYTSGAWTQRGIDIDGTVDSGEFGHAVSLSSDGSVLAVGTPWYTDSAGNSEAGQVKVYDNNAPLPTPIPTSAPSNPKPLPTPIPTSAPSNPKPSTTSVTTQSPVFVTLPFVGGCPAQVSSNAATGQVHFEPGDRVSNGVIVYECKSWPNSLFCSQKAFNPPSDLDTKSKDWKQAWDVVGHCSGTLTPPTVGCPDVWTPGDMTKYKENDQVSVIKSYSPLIQFVYKCKAWPYSWYCGQLSPFNHNGGVLGWDLVGECVGTISPTSSPTFNPLAVIAGCPDEYNLAAMEDYVAGDKVSVAIIGSTSHRNVYVCRDFPYSGYCRESDFAPGKQYDYMAWTLLGPCDGTLAPTSAPTSFSGGALCTYIKVDTTSPVPTSVVTPVGVWTAGTLYESGDQVRIGSKKFQCKPWPFHLWCRMSAYKPSLSDTGLWTEAWTPAGGCQ